MIEVRLTLNGTQRTVAAREDESLLEVLRERCGVVSLKDACRPQGQCGACLALVDGRPRTTCVMPAAKAEGREIVTLEGLPEADRRLLARAFVRAGGLQCGFCTPGLVLRAWHLLETRPEASRSEIARALDGHLCRCTGYARVLDAIELAAAARRGAALPEPDHDGRVGDPVARYRGEALALGEQPFVADLRPPGMLYGAVRLSDHARARVLAIDTSAAAALPGVHAVVTAADVPGERWLGLLVDDWPSFVAVGEEVRCVGDVLVAVAADDERTARAAAALVRVDYDALPPVTTPAAALADGASLVQAGRADNLLSCSRIARGDAGAALRASAHVARGSWRTQRIEHLFLEPECCLAAPRTDGKLHLYTQGQGVFDDRRQVARLLGVPEADVFVELVPNGGAFGGKEDLSVQAHAALLARATGRPVRVALDRAQSVRMHPKRHPIEMRYEVGCDADGHLTAVRAHLVGDTGAYASVGAKVLERAAGHACGAYRVPHVDVTAEAVRTNNPPCGAMRGFGVNQVHFALEACVDELAAKVGLDRWEMRWRNALGPGNRATTGQILTASVGIRRTLEAVRPAWEAARAAGRAAGISCGVKNSGIGNGVVEWGRARLVVEDDGTVALFGAFTEMGQGLLTVEAQIAAEVTGLPASLFRPRVDATFDIGCGQTTGSRATLLGGRAVEAAAARLREALDAGETLATLGGRVFAGDIEIADTTPLDPTDGPIKTHTTYGWATQVCVLDEAGRVDKLVAAHDVGRAINPNLCAAEIEGALHMGLGYALTEELPCEGGVPVTHALRELGVLRASDMPAVEVILVEEHEPEGPFGAKGVGEIGLVPTAAAVAGALEAFDGIRRRELPMKDSPAAQAMSVGKIKRASSEHRERWS